MMMMLLLLFLGPVSNQWSFYVLVCANRPFHLDDEKSKQTHTQKQIWCFFFPIDIPYTICIYIYSTINRQPSKPLIFAFCFSSSSFPIGYTPMCLSIPSPLFFFTLVHFFCCCCPFGPCFLLLFYGQWKLAYLGACLRVQSIKYRTICVWYRTHGPYRLASEIDVDVFWGMGKYFAENVFFFFFHSSSVLVYQPDSIGIDNIVW